MSIEAVAIALHHSKAKGTAKIVLLGIANHDGDGGSFPKVATLAKYANVHPRRVQESLNVLGALGEIIIHQNAGGTANTPPAVRPNLYEFILTCPEDCDRTKNHRLTGEKLGRSYKGQYVQHPVDNSTKNPETKTAPGDEFVSPPRDEFVSPPGDEFVSTKNHPLEPPIESALVPTSPAAAQAVGKPAKAYVGLTPEQMARNAAGAARARAALQGGSK
jgi:hypothetical protein